MLVTSMSTLVQKKKTPDTTLSCHGMLRICKILFPSLTKQWWSTTFDSGESSSRYVHDALQYNRIPPLSISRLWPIRWPGSDAISQSKPEN